MLGKKRRGMSDFWVDHYRDFDAGGSAPGESKRHQLRMFPGSVALGKKAAGFHPVAI